MEETRLREKPFLNLVRHYPVAPEKVWRAWTDPQALSRWWGPDAGDRVSLAQLDVRVGGRFRIVFGGPQGTEHEVQGFFDEAARDGHKRGWSGALVKLEAFLGSEQP